jgi:hypothetical protein
MSHELAERTDGGILVRLLWSSADDNVHVEYFDFRTGDAFRSAVPKAEAMTAFRHPNAYRGAAVAA